MVVLAGGVTNSYGYSSMAELRPESNSNYNINEHEFRELESVLRQVIEQSRLISADNDDPAVIPRERDRRLFRESMALLNLNLTGRNGIYGWLAKIKSGASSAAPNNDTWLDPITGMRWLVFSPSAVIQYNANKGCSALGNNWRLPELEELSAAQGRLINSGLRNLEVYSAYWSSFEGDATGGSEGPTKYGKTVCLQNGYIAWTPGANIMKPWQAWCNDGTDKRYDVRAFCVQPK
jgi:hypothetical protein